MKGTQCKMTPRGRIRRMTKLDESLMQKDEVIQALEKVNEALRNENKALKRQIEFARGAPVVELIRKWTGGTSTSYKDRYDVTTKNGTRLEIKYSKVHTLKNSVRRWTWNNILGTKEFDYLVLAGVKDQAYEYPDLPFVLFVVARSVVNDITSGGNCLALNTKLDMDRSNNHKLRRLKPYLVRLRKEFERFKYPTPPVVESANAKTTAAPT